MREFKHRFDDLIQIEFWVGQEAENEIEVKCDPLNQGFFDFTQVALRLVKRKKVSSQ